MSGNQRPLRAAAAYDRFYSPLISCHSSLITSHDIPLANMNLASVLERRDRVEAFLKQHRIGLLSLVFTDIVGSTRIKQRLGDLEAARLIHDHHALVRELLSSFKEAEEVSTAGDSFFIVFAKPSEAAKFGLLLQSSLRALTGGHGEMIRNRIGIHIGEVMIQEDPDRSKDLYGMQVDICARVMSLAEGDQILMTRSAFDNARQVIRGPDLPQVGPLAWVNHGLYLLKGIDEPIEICEVGETNGAALKPPADSEKVHRYASADGEPVLGWRPAADQRVPGTEWVLQERLGEGGFGEVWIGWHQVLKEQRVFKFCFRADRARSLKREVTLFRILKERIGEHPHIVPVREVYFEQPPYYLIVDYAGKDLRRWSEVQGRLSNIPLETRLEIVAQAAEGLQAAHEAGVIHRDIKPSNVLITQKEGSKVHAKLTDFGIGHLVNTEALSQLTQSGFTQTMLSPGSSAQTGTYLYMAPELIAGKPASTRSDIYSLGVVLYQMIVGDWGRPVTSDWVDHITDPLLRDDLKQCLAGKPEDRFAGAGQLAQRLRSLGERRAQMEREKAEAEASEKRAYRRGVLRTAAVAVLLCLVMARLVAIAWTKSRLAVRQTRIASEKALIAEKLAQESRLRLVSLTVEKGNRLLEEGDFTSASLYFIEALKLDEGHPDLEKIHRFRIAATLRQMPKLVQFICPSNPFAIARIRPDGLIATISGDGADFQVWSPDTGVPAGPAFTISSNLHRAVGLSGDGTRIWKAEIQWEQTNLWTTLRVWDAALGKEVAALSKVKNFGSVEASADGRKFFVVADGKIMTWQPDVGSEPVMVAQRTNVMRSTLVINPNGRQLAYIASPEFSRMYLVNAEGKKAPEEPLLHNAYVTSATFDSSGERLVTASADGMVRVWDSASGKPLIPPLKHDRLVIAAEFSPDGSKIATAGADLTVRIWNATNGLPLITPIKLVRSAHLIAFNQDGRRLLTVSPDAARIWNTATGNPETPYWKPLGRVWEARFAKEGHRVLMASALAQTWDFGRSQLRPLDTGRSGSVRTISFSPDEKLAVTTSLGNSAVVYDRDFNQGSRPGLVHSNRIERAWFTSDSQKVVTDGEDPRLWDIRTGKVLTRSFRGGGVTHVVFSPDGRHVATVETNRVLRLWAAEDGRMVCPAIELPNAVMAGDFGGLEDPPSSIVFSRDGKTLAVAMEGRIGLWDAYAGKPRSQAGPFIEFEVSGQMQFSFGGNYLIVRDQGRSITRQDQATSYFQGVAALKSTTGEFLFGTNFWKEARQVAFTKDGAKLAVVSAIFGDEFFSKVEVWDVAQEKRVSTLEKVPRGLLRIELSPDGQRAAASFEDGPTRIWDANTGKPSAPALKQTLFDSAPLFFTSDSLLLGTINFDGFVRLWDAATGQAAGPVLRIDHPISEMYPSPDGRFLVSRYQYLAEIWEMAPRVESRPVAELAGLMQFLTGSEINSMGDITPVRIADGAVQFQDAYLELRKKHPDDFVVAPEEASAWTLLAGLSPSVSSSPLPLIKAQPQGKLVRRGEDVSFEVSETAFAHFQWRVNGVPLLGMTNRALALKGISEEQLGSYSVVVSNVLGTVASKSAPLTTQPVISTICGQWDFNHGNLSATVGYDLAFLGGPDGQTARETRFGKTTAFGIPDIGGRAADVAAFPACGPLMGYILAHDAEPNGHGEHLNQYTLIMDVLWLNPNNQRFSAIIQIDDLANRNDSDLFVSWANGIGGIGINEEYDGDSRIEVGRWHRIAFAVDMDASPPVIGKYIDGRKHADQTRAADIGRDGRFALRKSCLLFTDESGETTPGYVNSIQLHNVRLSDEQIKALGGPKAEGIPWISASAGR